MPALRGSTATTTRTDPATFQVRNVHIRSLWNMASDPEHDNGDDDDDDDGDDDRKLQRPNDSSRMDDDTLPAEDIFFSCLEQQIS